jgi:hypothetical protein
MAPGGQRMPELASITLLEQTSQKRRMLRFFAGQICVIADYTKSECLESSDMEVGFWFGSSFVTCHVLRIVRGMSLVFALFLQKYFFQVILMIPILHTLATALKDPDAVMIPYLFSTASIRKIGDTYNWLLANAGKHERTIPCFAILLFSCRITIMQIHSACERMLGKRMRFARSMHVCKQVRLLGSSRA